VVRATSVTFAGGYGGNEQRPGVTGIFTVPSQGGEARSIAVPAGSVPLNPSWSPDGKWIAYSQTRSAPDGPGAGVSIWIVSSEGGPPKQLTSDADRVEEAELRWSPDGETIAYFGAGKTVRLIPSNGGPSQVLTQIPAVNSFLGLSWSPDGSKLACTTIQKAWVIPASGGEPREIPVGFDGRITQIDWSPDGQTSAFSGATGGEEEVWLMSDFVNLVKTARR
jgi:Tol biopolymer transport system component